MNKKITFNILLSYSKNLGICVICFFISALSILINARSVCAQGEQLTITTYYPSPYGSYRDLAVTNSLAAGPVDATLTPLSKINARNTDAPALNQYRYAIVGENFVGGTNVRGALGMMRNIGGVITRAGVYGSALTGGNRYAGYFDGDVMVNGNLRTNGRLAASTCVTYPNLATVQCPIGTYAIACGSGTCADMRNISNAPCPPAGYMICVYHAD